MSDEDFIAALEAGSLPDRDFSHANHLRAGYLYLCRYGFAGAVERMRATLQHYVALRGKADRYHETVTVAYLSLINRHLQRTGDCGGWAAFQAAHPILLQPGLLAHYYPKDVLESPEARRVFVLPRAA